jgi:type I restriction enzyme S subunit
MTAWKEVTLGDFINVKHGYAFKGDEITSDERPEVLVTPGNFYIGGGFKSGKFKFFKGVFPQSYVLNENDIVVTMTDLSKDGDTLGYGAKIPKSNGKVFLHNQRIGLVEFIRDDICKNFLYWILRTSEYQGFVLGAATGTSIRHTSPTTIKEYKFLLPSINEQKAISDVLSSLDDKIDLLHRQNQTLEAMAATLFRQWFVEELRADWEIRPLSRIAHFLNGLACQNNPPQNNLPKLPVLKIRELSGGISESSDWATSDVKPEYIVEAGDVIFAWSASLMVKVWDGERCVLNQHLFKVTSKEYPKWFYLMWCKHHLAEFISISASHATTMGHIKRGDLDAAMVSVPSEDELKAMSEQMTPLLNKQIAIAKQLRLLEKLRDTLLPKLMSGEVRVAY